MDGGGNGILRFEIERWKIGWKIAVIKLWNVHAIPV